MSCLKTHQLIFAALSVCWETWSYFANHVFYRFSNVWGYSIGLTTFFYTFISLWKFFLHSSTKFLYQRKASIAFWVFSSLRYNLVNEGPSTLNIICLVSHSTESLLSYRSISIICKETISCQKLGEPSKGICGKSWDFVLTRGVGSFEMPTCWVKLILPIPVFFLLQLSTPPFL